MKRFYTFLFVVVTLINFSSCSVSEEIGEEGDYGTGFRAADSESSVVAEKVYEYMPAPGQFINEGFDVATMAEACTYAEGRLAQQYYVSLGGWGGYIVVGFDHSVPNRSGYDLRIRSNAIDNSSEPGVVWVMQDSNGNGFPDDTWYELAGSEYGTDNRRANYSVTYYRPLLAGESVEWEDVDGVEGEIDYMAAEHTQDYYYPAWIEEDSYTLSGVLLKSNNVQLESGSWSNRPYDWGYVDNKSEIDFLTDGSNKFDIDRAVKTDGSLAGLKYIDFVKVQTGTNAKSGPLGENSTEVMSFVDMHFIK